MSLEACNSWQEKNASGLCATSRCRNRKAAGKKFCATCRSRAYLSPLKRKWLNLKISAKRKGREFGLSWEFFTDLAVATGYVDLAGRGSGDLHIDRIDPLRGYVPENVRVVTAHVNCRKAYVDRLKHAGVVFLDPELEPF